jgi:hypothetical protein
MSTGTGRDGRPARRNRDVSPIAQNMHSTGASQGVCIVKIKPAVIVSVSVVTLEPFGVTMWVSSTAINDTREPRLCVHRSHHPSNPSLQVSVRRASTRFSNSNALGSLVENSQSHLFSDPSHLSACAERLPISCNHVRYAHEVRVQEQSCQGYALVIILSSFFARSDLV